MEEHHPEIDVDFRANTTGVGGGHFDAFGNEICSDLWGGYCNSPPPTQEQSQ